MAGRNKRKGGAARDLVPTRFLLIFVLSIGVGLGYLWLRGRCEQAGRDITRLEGRRELLRRRASAEEFRWASLLSPRSIEDAISRHALDLDWPSGARIVRLYDSEADPFLLGDAGESRRYMEAEKVVLND